MSPSPRPSSGKVAGFVLLGVAAIALVIGLVTALSGPSDEQAGPPVSGTGTASPTNGGQTGGPPGSDGRRQPGASKPGGTAPSSPTTSYPRGSTTKVVPPPPADGGGGTAGGPGAGGGVGGGGEQARAASTRSEPVRVYNNSKITGLAQRAAADFRGAGFKVVQVGNYSQGIIPASTVYYRPGTGEQATATALANEFGMRVQARFPGIRDSSPGVIVIVTNNYSG